MTRSCPKMEPGREGAVRASGRCPSRVLRCLVGEKLLGVAAGVEKQEGESERAETDRGREGEGERQREREGEGERASGQRVENWTGRRRGLGVGGCVSLLAQTGEAAGIREIDQERVPGWGLALCHSGRSERRTTWVCLDAEACSESGGAQMGEGSNKMAKDVAADGNEARSDGRCGKPGPCSSVEALGEEGRSVGGRAVAGRLDAAGIGGPLTHSAGRRVLAKFTRTFQHFAPVVCRVSY